MQSLRKMGSLDSKLTLLLWMLSSSLPFYRYYTTTIRSIIPLPDPAAPLGSPAHLNAYPEFPAGSTVMALYPDTSCFYRAEVIASPRDMQPSGRVSNMEFILDILRLTLTLRA
jgi:SGF29 tudor-like domain